MTEARTGGVQLPVMCSRAKLELELAVGDGGRVLYRNTISRTTGPEPLCSELDIQRGGKDAVLSTW